MASKIFDTIVQRPDRILMRTFRPVSFPAFKITQTKFITYKDHMYCVLGQKTYNSPLYTHFIVIDSYGNLVDDQIGLKIYEKVSRLNIVQYMNQGDIFKEVKNYPKAQTLTKLKKYDQLNIESMKDLLTDQKSFASRFAELLEEAEVLFAKSEWEIADFKSFDRQWRQFWSRYDRRVETLLQFRDTVLEAELLNEISTKDFHSLFKEANHMYQLFVQMIPVDRPLAKKVSHYIQIQFELGRTRTSKTRKYVISTSESVLYYFFRYGFIISLILGFWVLLRFIMKTGGIIPLIAIIILAMFFFSIRLGNEVGILRMIDQRLKNLRKKRLSSIKTVERLYEKKLQEIEQQSETVLPTFKFTGRLVKVPRWFILFGIGIVFASLLVLMTRSPLNYEPGFTIFGALLIIIGIILPKTKLTKRIIHLKENMLQISKQTYSIEDVIYFQTYDKHHRIKIRLRTHPDPITFRIAREKGQAINDQITTWCRAHFVTMRS